MSGYDTAVILFPRADRELFPPVQREIIYIFPRIYPDPIFHSLIRLPHKFLKLSPRAPRMLHQQQSSICGFAHTKKRTISKMIRSQNNRYIFLTAYENRRTSANARIPINLSLPPRYVYPVLRPHIFRLSCLFPASRCNTDILTQFKQLCKFAIYIHRDRPYSMIHFFPKQPCQSHKPCQPKSRLLYSRGLIPAFFRNTLLKYV